MAMPKVVSADGSALSQEDFQVGMKVAQHLSFNKVGVFSHDDQASGINVEYHASTGIAYVRGCTDYVWGVLPAPFIVRDPAYVYISHMYINSIEYAEYSVRYEVLNGKVPTMQENAYIITPPRGSGDMLPQRIVQGLTSIVGYGKAYTPVTVGSAEVGYTPKVLATTIGTTTSYPPSYGATSLTSPYFTAEATDYSTIGSFINECFTPFPIGWLTDSYGNWLGANPEWKASIYSYMTEKTNAVVNGLVDGTFIPPDTWYEAVVAQMPLEYETYKEIQHPEPFEHDWRGDMINVTLTQFAQYRAQPIIYVDIVLLGRVGAAAAHPLKAVQDYICVFDGGYIDTKLATTLELNGTYRFFVDRVNKKLIWKSYTKIKSANQGGTKTTVEAMLDTSGTGGTDTRRKNGCNAIFVYHANFKKDVVAALRARNKDMTSGDFKYTSKVFYKILQAIGAMK